MNFPEGLKYTDDHEWIKVEGNTATIGITEHAASELGDVVYLDIEADGDVSKGDTLGTIEAVKTVADLFSPVSGKVIEINESINDNPEVVNDSPYDDGWMLKIELSDSSEINDLLDVDKYKDIIGQ